MENFDFDFDDQHISKLIDIEAPRSRSIWGVEGGKGYEKGWSSRMDRNTPALHSNACVWYFEAEDQLPTDTSHASGDEPQTGRKPEVSVTYTIPI